MDEALILAIPLKMVYNKLKFFMLKRGFYVIHR